MPNETSEDQIHKYTINIPKSLWQRVKIKTGWGSKYNNRVSPYILHLIESDCNLGLHPQARCPDPPKKYHGFQFGLKNPFYLRSFLKKSLTFRDASDNIRV